MSPKEIAVILGILAFGYWLGKSGVISRYVPAISVA